MPTLKAGVLALCTYPWQVVDWASNKGEMAAESFQIAALAKTISMSSAYAQHLLQCIRPCVAENNKCDYMMPS